MEALTGKGLKNVLVIVTRYFGGTLLGTGGLVRAYSQAAQAGLAASRIITKQAGCLLTVDTDYTENVQMKLLVPTEICGKVQKEITEATSGQAEIRQDEKEVYFACIDKEIKVFDA